LGFKFNFASVFNSNDSRFETSFVSLREPQRNVPLPIPRTSSDQPLSRTRSRLASPFDSATLVRRAIRRGSPGLRRFRERRVSLLGPGEPQRQPNRSGRDFGLHATVRLCVRESPSASARSLDRGQACAISAVSAARAHREHTALSLLRASALACGSDVSAPRPSLRSEMGAASPPSERLRSAQPGHESLRERSAQASRFASGLRCARRLASERTRARLPSVETALTPGHTTPTSLTHVTSRVPHYSGPP